MRRLAATAATLAQGDLSARARIQSPAELTSLAGSLNTMASRLEGLVDETVSDRDRAEGLVASLAEGVLAVSDRGEVTVANTAARGLLGVAPEVTTLDLKTLPESVRQVWDEARDGLERTSVVEASLPGGVSLLLQAVRVSREAGVVITIRDITEERRLNRARRDLIANVSHELKTPLTAVKGFLELIEDEHMDPARRKEFVGLMELEVKRLERLIAEQLELARIDAGALPLDRGPHDLAAIAEDVAASRRHLADLGGVDLVASIPPNPVMADVDPARVEQILLILLDNAIKHTPQGGKITVGVGVERDTATLTVRDTGAGIAPEAQPFIFDRFYQADQSREGPGLGLGLAIARGLTEAHGGSVDVRSAMGVGSVFIVRLPLRARVPKKVGIRT
jgi:signal transduction histidine kinase